MISYCVNCGKETDTNDIKEVKAKNGRPMIRGKCAICKKVKTAFVKNKNKTQLGGSPIDFVVNKLPFEMHLVDVKSNGMPRRYNYCGPGTKLAKRLARGDQGINDLDKSCKLHDIAYDKFKTAKERHPYDSQLAQAADRFLQKPGISTSEKINARLVSGVMKGKVRFGI